MRSPGRACPILLSILLVVPLLISTAGLSAAADDQLPPAELTGGGRMGDGVSEGFGDIVAPVVLLKSGLIFVNPRASYTDDSSEEYNLGVGYRHLLAPKNLILGANIYYDYRETERHGRFHQAGFGLEILGEWVDARANYYLPEDKKETVNEYDVETVSQSTSYRDSGWGAPYATGNGIVQDNLSLKTITTTTTKQHFEQYEEAMEGWDCELGVRLPIPVVMDYADIKVFGGYYAFNASFGEDDIRGFKGRFEIKALPAVYLDAEFYEDRDLTGSDYFFGARVRFPFDVGNISKGRNPFAGTMAGFAPSSKRAPFASRLTEMVMRDLHVRTEVSEVIEDVSRREENTVSQSVTEESRYTLVANANFVDGDNKTGVENGTAEHPYDTIKEGVSNAVGEAVVYVFDAVSTYQENVVLGNGMTVWGSGCLIEGQAGMTFGSGIFPIVDGRSRGPTFTLANNTTLRGLEIINTEDAQQPSRPFFRPEWGTVETRRVGVFADDVTPVAIECTRVNSVQYGALLGMDGSFAVTLENNEFQDAELDGVRIAGYGSSGTFIVDARQNAFTGNGSSGLEIMSGNYDSADVSLLDNLADGNGGDGVRVFSDNNGPVTVTVGELTANDNGNDGLKVQAFSASAAAPVTVSIHDSELDDNGYCGAEVFSGTGGNASTNQVTLTNVSAQRNGEDGVYADSYTLGVGSPVGISLTDVDANDQVSDHGVEIFATGNGSGDADVVLNGVNAISNGGGGVYADVRTIGSGGNAGLEFLDVAANDNGGDGFDVNAQASNGSAFAFFSGGIQANGNGGSGIRVQSVQGHLAGGMTRAYFEEIEANGNGGTGIQVDRVEDTGLGGLTIALLSGVDANANGGDGISFSNVRSAAGQALFQGLNVVASSNGGYGVRALQVEANGQDDEASLQLHDVTADDNGVDGLYAAVVSYHGPAEAEFIGVRSDGNSSNGIYLAHVRAYGDDDGASAIFADVESSANSNRGIYAYVSGHDGPGSAQFINVVANGNRADGIYLDYVEAYSAGADAEATFTDVEASGNGGDGIAAWSDAYGLDGDALMSFLRTTTHNNRGCGIYTEVYSDYGDAYLSGERVVSYSNRQDGVQIYTYAWSEVFADFGNGALGSAGLCSIYSNTVFNMSNTGSDPVSAQSNWWGSATPAPGKFSGNIDRANPLAIDPNP